MNYKGAVLIVSHDRYFLDRVVSKVVEIFQHKGYVYQGNYSDYAKKKAAIRAAMIKQYYNQQREIRHQEEVIAKLKSFNREKSIKRQRAVKNCWIRSNALRSRPRITQISGLC